MYQPVEDRVSKGGIGDAPVPFVNRDLGGDEGGGVAKAVVEDFENVLRILDGDGIAHPVIQDQQVTAGQRTQSGREGTIGANLAEAMQQARGAVVTDGEAIANCCLSKGGS